jgi:hypothetical protein
VTGGWAPAAWSWDATTVGALHVQGMPLVLSDMLPDGDLVALLDVGVSGPPLMVLGTGPVSDAEWCRREAKSIVHEGLSDVLEWLGWPRYTPPSSAGVLEALRGPAAGDLALRCDVCGADAVTECSEASSLYCGRPLCGQHNRCTIHGGRS